jgi:hypothetical protein
MDPLVKANTVLVSSLGQVNATAFALGFGDMCDFQHHNLRTKPWSAFHFALSPSTLARFHLCLLSLSLLFQWTIVLKGCCVGHLLSDTPIQCFIEVV